jgi:hypothetical protein
MDHRQIVVAVKRAQERRKRKKKEELDVQQEDLYISSSFLFPSVPIPAVLITNPITWWLLAINLYGRKTDSFLPSSFPDKPATPLPPARLPPNYNKDLH